MKLRPKMLHSSSYARITQESRATNLRSHYAEVTQFLRRDYAVFTQQLRRFTQPLRNHYAKFTQSLRKVYAIQLRSITQFITQLLYAIALRNCFTQLFYAIVLRNCFTQLFYAFLRMSVNEKFTQKSCNLRKGQLADGRRSERPRSCTSRRTETSSGGPPARCGLWCRAYQRQSLPTPKVVCITQTNSKQ